MYNTEHDILDKDEEIALIIKSQSGDVKATARLVETNIRWIFKIAKKYGLLRNEEYVEDIIQDGVIGLLKAIEKFDINSGLRLSTYSAHWIRQCLTRPVQQGAYTGHMSYPVHHSKVCGILMALEGDINEDNVFEKYMEEVKRRDIQNTYGESQVLASWSHLNTTSLSGDMIIGESEESDGSHTLFDDITLEKELSPEQLVVQQAIVDKVNYMLDDIKISDRDATIVRARFGIGYPEPKTLEEVGAMIGITRERVRQIQVDVLKKLKVYLNFENIKQLRDIL